MPIAQDVFISYAHENKPVADAICARIEQRGVRCWIAPRDVSPGEHWPAAITAAIDGSRVMVLVYTKAYNESSHTLREVERAVAHGLHIIPFRVEAEPLSQSLEYLISMPHWLDAMTPPLEGHLARLAEVVETVVRTGKPSGPRDGGTTPRQRPASAHRWVWAAAVASLAIVAIGIAYFGPTRGTPNANVDPSADQREPRADAGGAPPTADDPAPQRATPADPSPPSVAGSGPAREPEPSPAPRSVPGPSERPATDPLPSTREASAEPTHGSPPAAPPKPAFEAELAALIDRWKGQTLPVLIVWTGEGYWGGTRLDLSLHHRKDSEVTFDVTCAGQRRDPVTFTLVGDRLTGASISELAPGSERWGPGSSTALSLSRVEPEPGINWAGVDQEADIFEAHPDGGYRVMLVAPRGRTEWVTSRLFAGGSGSGFGAAGEWHMTKGGRHPFDVIVGTQVAVPVGTLTPNGAWELRGEFVAKMDELPGAVNDGLKIIVQIDPTPEHRANPQDDSNAALRRTIEGKTGRVEIRVEVPKGAEEVVLTSTGYHLMWNNLRLVPKPPEAPGSR